MADDKTRVLTAEEAARLVEEAARPAAPPRAARKPATARPEPQAPWVDGDKIVFFCPNGHKIVVDRAWAGKRGTCSKSGCNAPVIIPSPPGVEPPPSALPAVGPPGEPQEVEAAPVDAGSPPAPPEPEAGGPPELPADAAAAAPVAGWEFTAEAGDAPPDIGFDPAAEGAGWSIDIDEIENPTARLVARLWVERAHGGIVEVHLSGGGVIMPEWYDPRWSGGAHALFAAQAADGTVTLTAVAWDQIQKVVVRQVQGTPEGMFEG